MLYRNLLAMQTPLEPRTPLHFLVEAFGRMDSPNARPSRVRPMNTCSEIIKATATAMMNRLSTGMSTLPIEITQVSGKIFGEFVWNGPYRSITMFWRMNETPMAVIRGARRGAFRSGLYARRSITTPTRPMMLIVITNVAASVTTRIGMS